MITDPFDVDTDVEIQWRGIENDILFFDGEFDPQDWSPPGGVGNGSPEVHRFIGLFHEEGIRYLILDNVAQSDHLQYGYSIPEPSGIGFLVSSLVIGLIRRKR